MSLRPLKGATKGGSVSQIVDKIKLTYGYLSTGQEIQPSDFNPAKFAQLAPEIASIPLKLADRTSAPHALRDRFSDEKWQQIVRFFEATATLGTLWKSAGEAKEALMAKNLEQAETEQELAMHGSLLDKIREAETKADFLQSLLTEQRSLIKSLVEKGEDSGDLVGTREAAKALGISSKTLREKADSGEIPYHGTGKQKRFNIAEIKEATKVESTTEKKKKVKSLLG